MEKVKKLECHLPLERSEALVAEVLELLERHQVLDESLPAEAGKAASLKISLRRREDISRLKIKIATEIIEPYDHGKESDQLADPKLKYGKLKKMMKRSFNALSREVLSEKMPEKEILANFLAQSARMVTYSGRGDEHYARYSDACFALEQACNTGDLERMHQAWERIVRIKQDCHQRYK